MTSIRTAAAAATRRGRPRASAPPHPPPPPPTPPHPRPPARPPPARSGACKLLGCSPVSPGDAPRPQPYVSGQGVQRAGALDDY